MNYLDFKLRCSQRMDAGFICISIHKMDFTMSQNEHEWIWWRSQCSASKLLQSNPQHKPLTKMRLVAAVVVSLPRKTTTTTSIHYYLQAFTFRMQCASVYFNLIQFGSVVFQLTRIHGSNPWIQCMSSWWILPKQRSIYYIDIYLLKIIQWKWCRWQIPHF